MSEPQLKAAFLVSFLKYVEWPASADGATICLVGHDAVRSHLTAYEGRVVLGKELRIRAVSRREDLGGCQELYLAPGEEGQLPELIKAADHPPVLVVGEGEPFLRKGGAIALVRIENRLAFDVNLQNASKARLRLSPQMLRVARDVIGGPR